MSFIDDYFQYRYLYLIHEKSQSSDMFKLFKAEFENQLGKKIKIIRSDRGGEYYGGSSRLGEQHPRPFIEYLAECRIMAQYIIPGTPHQNGVAE